MDHPHRFPRDPRAPNLTERRAWAGVLRREDQTWRPRLRALADPPPADDFPCFLLATAAFQGLAQALGGVQRRADLPTDVADELDHFVAAYRDYLRTCAGEDVFGAARRG